MSKKRVALTWEGKIWTLNNLLNSAALLDSGTPPPVSKPKYESVQLVNYENRHAIQNYFLIEYLSSFRGINLLIRVRR